jgi:soluble lytic murein transglycosylase-like protein
LRESTIFGRVAILLLAMAAGFGQQASADPSAATVATAERYENGESVPRDYHRALGLYCEAARRGDTNAYFQLGWMYLNGRGVERDDASAVMWLRKAAAGGISQATNLLALLPQNAAGRDRNCSTAGASALSFATPPPAIKILIDQTAQETGVDPRLIQSVISVESNFNAHAVSPKLAAGLMQLMPETADRFGVRDVFDERENVRAGAVYLRSLLQMFGGDMTLALAAYNAGEGAVLSHRGVPPYRETQEYVAIVKRLCACNPPIAARNLPGSQLSGKLNYREDDQGP